MKVIGNLTKDAIIRAAVSEGQTFTQAAGTPVDFDTVATTSSAIAFDSSNNKVVVAYTDQGNGYQGRAVVGTVDASNNSISFGSVATFHAAEVQNDTFGIVFDSSNNKIVICFTDSADGNKGKAIVGTVSGTSISFGSAAQFSANNTTMMACTFDSNLNKVVAIFKNTTVSNYGQAAVGTVSGTSISFGSAVVFNSNNTSYPRGTFDSSNNKVVISYRNQSTTYGTAIVGTVSGTSISFGTAVAYNSTATTYQSITFDSTNNKVVIAANRGSGYAIVGTVSGTSISFGSQVQFDTGGAEYNNCAFDSNTGKVVITYNDGNNSNRPTFIAGEVSGTSISFDTPVTAQNETTNANMGITFDSNAKKIVGTYKDSGGGDNRGEAVVFQTAGSIASGGTIADGKAVIVNANGTVTSVSASSQTQEAGTSASYESDTSGSSKTAAIVHDTTNNKILVVYGDAANSDYGTAVVGTVSGTSISFGTPVVFESAYARFGSNQHQCATFIDDKIVIVYGNGGNSNVGTAIHGTISGTSITFSGSTPIFNSGNTYEGAVVCTDTVNNKIIIAYRDEGNSNYGAAIVGTINGASISFGSEHTFRGAAVQSLSIAFDESAGAAVVAYRTSSGGQCNVLTVSGTDVSGGATVTFNSAASTTNNNVVYDSNAQKTVITYVDGGNSSYGTAIVGTVSGTSISFGSEVVYNAATTAHAASAFDSNINRIVVAYSDGGSVGNFTTGIVSGNSITFGQTETQFAAFNVFNTVLCFDSTNKKCIVAYMKGSSSYDNLSAVLTPEGNIPNLTSENFVGFMDGAALDGTNGEILSSCSIARNQTSLTPGQTYFVSPTDGALSETAGSPSVTAGTAISNTELIVKG